MNDYEIMLLLDPEIAEERGDEIIQRIRTTVEAAQGSWDGHEPWGRRRLAFEINHKSEAVYHLLLFSCPPESLEEIVRVLKITDGVMRHGAYRRVKGAGHLKPPSQIAPPQESSHEESRRPAPAPAAPAEPAAEAEPTETEPVEAEPVEAEPVASAVAASEASDDTDGAAE